jgi:hypothetical protein
MTKRSRELTLATLKAAHACQFQCNEFEARFGDRVNVTVLKARLAASLFDWNWAMDHLLAPPGRDACARAFDNAWTAYERRVEPARKAHDRAQFAADEVYERDANPIRPAWRIAQVREAFFQAIRPTEETLNEARDAAEKALQLAKAEAWARAYIADGN